MLVDLFTHSSFLAQSVSGGSLTYRIVMLTLLTAGMFKLSMIRRRSRVNKLCILALMVLLGGWMILVLGGIFSGAFPNYPLIGVVLNLTAVASLVASLALSVAGLMRDQARYNEFVQGKGQGVTALILSILLLTVIGLGLAMGNGRTPQAENADTAWWGSPTDKDLEITGSEEFRESNFRIGKLDYPWVRTLKEAVDGGARMLYHRTKPELFMTAAAESNGTGISLHGLQTLVLARLKRMSSAVEEVARESHVLGGASFVRITYKVSGINGSEELYCYDQWLACTPRHAYQFSCSGLLTSIDRLRGASQAWMDTFALLEPIPESGGSR